MIGRWLDELSNWVRGIPNPAKNAAGVAIYEWDSLDDEDEIYALAIDPLKEFVHDMREKYGWELIKDVPLGTGKIFYKLSKYLREGEEGEEGEEGVPGNVLRVRARRKWGCAGQRHAELFFTFRKKIRKALRKYGFLFPGTEWRDSKGIIRIPILYWKIPENIPERKKWVLDFDLIDPAIHKSKIVLEEKWRLGFCPISPDVEWGPFGRFVLLRGPSVSPLPD